MSNFWNAAYETGSSTETRLKLMSVGGRSCLDLSAAFMHTFMSFLRLSNGACLGIHVSNDLFKSF